MDIWDLRGVNCVNPFGYPVNYWTEEFLDSMLALSRFTSLVRWKQVSGSSYRPMRVTRDLGGPRMELRSTASGQSLPEDQWLWTGASDGTITVGWIVRNYPHNYTVPECEDSITPVPPPKVNIYGLTQGVPLELAWFDDHKGQLIGQRSVTTTGQFTNVVVPSTEPGGFWKSIAFLIQPVGFTPVKDFEPLPSYPNHMIGQIIVTPRGQDWYEEYQEVTAPTATYCMTAKPPITDATPYRFIWSFEHPSGYQTQVEDGRTTTTHSYQHSEAGAHRVSVDVLDKTQQDKRVSGDIIYVFTFAW
jgi:hypothetical protein